MLFNFAKECLSDSKDDFNIKSNKFKTSKVIFGCLFALSVTFNYVFAKRILTLNAKIEEQTTITTESNINDDMLAMDLKACQDKNKFYSIYIKERCNKNTSTTLSDVNHDKVKVVKDGRN